MTMTFGKNDQMEIEIDAYYRSTHRTSPQMGTTIQPLHGSIVLLFVTIHIQTRIIIIHNGNIPIYVICGEV